MGKVVNNPIFKERRRALRKNQTEAERILWAHVRNAKLGHHFWRQYSIGPYILDFYSPALKIAIELDGKHHAEQEHKVYDKERELYLEGLEIRTIRFWNEEVISNVEKVIARINSALPLIYKRE